MGSDRYVFILILLLLLFWSWVLIRKWLTKPEDSDWEIEVDEEIPVTEAVALLEEAGYEVMTLKRKLNIYITVDDVEEYQSRLFIDHFVREGEKLYVVKLAKARQPLEMTGSSLRDKLLFYPLIFSEAEGVLYVDPKLKTIQKIQFEIEGDEGE